MRLIGPYPFMAHGQVMLAAYRKPDGVTIVINDSASTGLDEISFRLLGLSDAQIEAYEAATKAFNNALAMARAKEAA